MSERETKELDIAGHKVVTKTYLAVSEMQPILDPDPGTPELSPFKKAFETLKLAIVSLDGSAENIGTRLLDLPVPAYTEFIKTITPLVNPSSR